MEIFFSRFSHVTENIFDQLDDKRLVMCRIVNKSWKSYLDNQKFLQIRIIKATIKDFHEVGSSWAQVFDIASTEMIMDLEKAIRRFYKTDSNLTYNQGLTPLHIAAGTGNQLLLLNIYRKAVQKCPKDEEGLTPLHYSAQNGHFEVCEFLMANMSDKNLMGKNGSTPLHKAALRGNLKICKFIMERNQDINPKRKGAIQ